MSGRAHGHAVAKLNMGESLVGIANSSIYGDSISQLFFESMRVN